MTNDTAPTRMTHRELIDEAKSIVLADGPSNCLEFTDEMIARYYMPDELAPGDFQRLMAEVCKQAQRVYVFLGLT